MAHRKSAVKALRQAKKRAVGNKKIKSELHTRVKKFRSLLKEKKLEEAKNALRVISSRFDKAAVKKIIHQNKASRHKSRLASALHRVDATRP